ncbi:hypothetical protein [Iamia sp.]|uniref:hypothetical protein n=1 Tax=Iamia sp. TaxID=2722710 RepID=UPI002BA7218F|nr:hypothetical protein [Iamia sp.]HXH59402.1 hypothetical protein [Iamia sp.]
MKIPRNPTPVLAVLVASVAGVSGLVGTYWDDTWHTDRGRDTLLAPPHVVIYLSVLAALAAVAVLGRRPRGPAQRMALVGGAAVLASAPVDEAWHRGFGRDAVTWSPPHMVAVVASLMLATGVLALAVGLPGRWGRAAQVLAAAAVIGVLQVPVFELDSDVPQFPEWTYLPVAVVGWLLATVLVRRLLPDRWSLIAATGIYTVIRVGITGLLAVLGHSATIVPPILILGVLHELVERTVRRRSVRLVVEAVGATVVWFAWLKAFGAATTAVPASALPAALAVAVLGAVGVAALSHTGGWRRPRALPAGAVVLIVALGAVFSLAPVAGAHDPGQGRATRAATLTADRLDETSVMVELDVDAEPCRDLIARRTTARRAGDTRSGPLEAAGPCRYRGVVEAEAGGRWFLYVELTERDRRVELWVPLAGDETTASVHRPLYEPPARPSGGPQAIGGVVLYVAILGMLLFTVRSAARIGPAASLGRA